MGTARRWAWATALAFLTLTFVERLEGALPIESIQRDETVVFSEEILPFLQRNCLACHSKTRSKADLVLETPEAMRVGGVSGSALIPGKPEESLVFLAAAHLEPDLEMPPEGNKSNARNLKSKELGLLKLWIEQGAPEDDGLGNDTVWEPLPTGFRPIYAVDVSNDGSMAACGRANQIFIYNLETGNTEARLTNPALLEEGLYERPGVAHRDLVHSLAWSPDGRFLASGDYRAIHIWERERGSLIRSCDLGQGVSLATATHPRNSYSLFSDTHGRLTQFVIATGEPRLIETRSSATTDIVFNPSGSHWLTASRDGRIALWDASLSILDTINSAKVSAGLCWLDDFKFASIQTDGVLRFYSLDAGKIGFQRETAVELEDSEPLEILAGKAEDSKDNVYIVLKSGKVWWFDSTSKDHELQFDTGKPLFAAAGALEDSEIYFAQRDGQLSCWNIQDRTLVHDWSMDPVADRETAYWRAESAFAKSEVAFRDQRFQDFNHAKTEALARLNTAESTLEMKRAALEAAGEKFMNSDSEYESARKGITDSEQKIQKLTTRIEKLFAEQKTLQERIAKASTKNPESVDRKALAKVVTQLSDISFERGQLEIDLKEAQAKKNTLTQSDPKTLENLEKARDVAGEELAIAKREVSIAEEELRLAGIGLESVTGACDEARVALTTAKAYQSQSASRLAPETRDSPLRVTAMTLRAKQLWIASADGRLQSFDRQTGADTYSINTEIAPVFELTPVDNKRIAVIGAQSTFQLWNTQPVWKLKQTLDAQTVSSAPVDRAYSLAFSKDGAHLAVGGGEPTRTGQLIVYNTENWNVVYRNDEVHSDSIFSLSFSHSGTYLATASADRFVKVLNMETLEIANTFEGHTGYALDVDWARDERALASSGADGKVIIWDRLKNQKERDFKASQKEATSVAFAGYTREAIATGAEPLVRLFKEDGKPLRSYEGAKDYIGAAATNWDGSVILVGGQDSVLRVWRDTESKQWATFGAPE